MRGEQRLTFGLIVQPDHVADVFELGQLVNLDAARCERSSWLLDKAGNSQCALLPPSFVYLLSPQEAALFSAGEMATLFRLSLWL